MLLPLAMLVVVATQPGSGNVADVRSLLSGGSPSQVVSLLVASGGWRRFTSLVASGDQDAIALVPSVFRGTDAGTASDLTIAMAEALPRSPAAVLANLDPAGGAPLSAERVCGDPFPGESDEHREAWISGSRDAADTAGRGDASLLAAGEDCVKALDALGPTPADR